ncbi:hypothetical protein BS639_18570 [Rouxiella silvae]|uniref:Uncharacterized protein n=1 Tax=Rouxiella silvae TaxID=1646373 RepID=A0ABX3TX47_9GAMM|nr:hypothetical protein BS639_18570 [Rouxiella silvae]
MKFFQDDKMKEVISNYTQELVSFQNSQHTKPISDFSKMRTDLVILILNHFISDQSSWDESCPYNIKRISNKLTKELEYQEFDEDSLSLVF